jgi:hypothetical protein
MFVPSVETDEPSISPTKPKRAKAAVTEASNWLTRKLARTNHSRLTRAQVVVICATIFIGAIGVRFLHWQDSHVEIVAGRTALSGVFNRYQKEARRILDEGGILFPREQPAPGDARMLAHPPGYSILLAAIYRMNGNPYTCLWIVQVVCDASEALLVFLIALELLNWSVALIAAALAAISPHLACYSLLLSPDSLAVLPILFAVYLIIKAWRRGPQTRDMILAGALIGLACWLNANAMLLGPFLGAVILLTFERGKRSLFAAAVVASAMIVIAPITIRNAMVFHRFIPISIQAGLSLVEGLGDYDKDGRLGMPRSDREARQKDSEWNARPDYAPSLWYPDGIDRDRTRLSRGLSVVRSHPAWFMGISLHRAAFMLSYNDSRAREWPQNTASASPVSAEARYGQPIDIIDKSSSLSLNNRAVLVLNGTIIPGALAVKDDRQPISSTNPLELQASGTVLSQQASVFLAEGGQTLQIGGDNSEYGDEFTSAPIAVRKHTDYVLVVPVLLLNADMAIKVTSSDRRIALAAAALADAEKEANSLDGKSTSVESSAARPLTSIQLPFASGDRTEVRLVMSNNSTTKTLPAMQLGTSQLFETGTTPYRWTRYGRVIVRAVQRNFTTILMRTLILLGMGLVLLARRGKTLLILLIVPVYYVILQAPLHTEYRYTLAIHYFLFISAAVTLYTFGAAAGNASRMMTRRLALRRTDSAVVESPYAVP